MNMYIWKSVKALRRYAPGFAMAIAHTQEAAINMIAQDFEDYQVGLFGTDDEYAMIRVNELRQELKNIEPSTHHEPMCFWSLGSE